MSNAQKNARRLTGLASVKEYGAKGDGVTDDRAAFEAAMAASASVYLPEGTYYLATPATVPSNKNLTVYGAGSGSVVYALSAAFQKGDPANPLGHITFRNLVLRGDRVANPSQLAGAHLINLAYGKSLRLDGVTVEQSRFFGVLGFFFDEVVAQNCRVSNISRDGMNFSGSRKVKVLGGFFDRIGDDAISVHQESGNDTAPYERDLIIQGVTITDCFGIKALGVRRAQIIGNTLERCKGYCVYIGSDANSSEGFLSQYDVLIADNIMANWLIPTMFGYVNTDDHAIVVGGYGGGTQRPYIVGGAAPTKTDPRDTINAAGAAATHSPNRRLRITNNILVKEQKGGVNYSAWGYGTAYVDVGLTADPAIPASYGVSQGVGIDIGGRWIDVQIKGNTFHGIATAIRGQPGGLPVFELVQLDGNKFTRLSGRGLDLSENGPHARGVVLSTRNHFNLDPMHENVQRAVAANGTWQITDSNYGVALLAFNIAIVSDGDTFENCQLLVHGAGGANVRKNSTIIGDPAAAKGVPNVAFTNLIQVQSDPTNAAYGNLLAVS